MSREAGERREREKERVGEKQRKEERKGGKLWFKMAKLISSHLKA